VGTTAWATSTGGLTPAGPAHRHERLRRLGARQEVPDEPGYKCRVFQREGMRSSPDDGEPAARQRFEQGIGIVQHSYAPNRLRRVTE
jgi:hypothetical protein